MLFSHVLFHCIYSFCNQRKWRLSGSTFVVVVVCFILFFCLFVCLVFLFHDWEYGKCFRRKKERKIYYWATIALCLLRYIQWQFTLRHHLCTKVFWLLDNRESSLIKFTFGSADNCNTAQLPFTSPRSQAYAEWPTFILKDHPNYITDTENTLYDKLFLATVLCKHIVNKCKIFHFYICQDVVAAINFIVF